MFIDRRQSETTPAPLGAKRAASAGATVLNGGQCSLNISSLRDFGSYHLVVFGIGLRKRALLTSCPAHVWRP
jgi:hypothetical protein